MDHLWRQPEALDEWPNGLLAGLGYEFAPPEVVAKERSDLTECILRRRLTAAVQRLNGPLDDLEVERAIRPLTAALAATPVEANELVHRALLGSVRLIDFDEPNNNEFMFARQWQTRGSHKTVTADVVVFVNGIPVVVVERAASTRGESVETAIERLLQHQGMEERLGGFGAPRLFHTAQILVATCGLEARYGTVGTPPHLFSEWKTADRGTSDEPPRFPSVSSSPGSTRRTPADEALAGLLQKRTLLDLVRDFSVFQTGPGGREKKVARPAQVALVDRVMERVESARQPAARGGIVHHAHGSGKSLSIVFLVTRLQRLMARKGGALVVVSDRQDLGDQLSEALVGAGYSAPRKTDDPTAIREFVSKAKGQTAVASVAHFQRAVCGRCPFATNGDHVYVIVDEAFRSNERRLTGNMRRALPNACLLGFTGAPLDKIERGTFTVFGSCVHRYTTEQAAADRTIVPVYYEKRRPLVDLKREPLRRLATRLFRPRRASGDEVDVGVPPSDAPPGALNRVDLICIDLVDHFETHVRPNGFKAQVVVKSRRAAVETKETLDALGVLESAVVISSLGTDAARLRRWHTTKEERHALLARFRDPLDPLAVLVVCDQLLTDFDAGVGQVLYVDAPLRGRWLQATTRVNRIAEGKSHGLIVDYSTNARHAERALRAGNLSPPGGRVSTPPSPHRELKASTSHSDERIQSRA